MTRTARLGVALGINLVLSIGLVVTGRAAHSTGLIADAGHNLTDAMALVLALTASVLATRPVSATRSYGWGRASTLAALANGIVLVIVTVGIAWIAARRLVHPRPIEGAIVLASALGSVVLNLAVVRLLHEHDHDLGVRSALLHAIGDTFSAAAVALAGLIALLASGRLAERVDPIAALVVAVLIIVEALRITGASIHVLLEGVPSDIDLVDVETALTAIPEIHAVHDLHVWSLSSTSRVLSAHLEVSADASISATSPVLHALHAMLEERFGINHATLELEAEGNCGHALHD